MAEPVAAVEAPPAQPSGEPSGEAGPSGLLPPRVLAGSPSDIADELGCEFRRGQRVVRALLEGHADAMRELRLRQEIIFARGRLPCGPAEAVQILEQHP